MRIEPTSLPGAYLLHMPAHEDARGVFVKPFQSSVFKNLGVNFHIKESYFSISHQGVIRGMHFQDPVEQHSKIVYCPHGSLVDVIVDLRQGSPTYKKHFSAVLSDSNHTAIYIPEGFAHGFKSLEDETITYYLVSGEYSPDHDTGILYSSIGFDWEIDNPLLSARDLSFEELKDFRTYFIY